MLIKFTPSKRWTLTVLIVIFLLLSACSTNRYHNTTIEFPDGPVSLHMNIPTSVYVQELTDNEVQLYRKKELIGRIVLKGTVQTDSTPEKTMGAIFGEGKDYWKVTEKYLLSEQYAQSNYLFSSENGRIGGLASKGNLCIVTELSADSLPADEVDMLIGSMVIETL